MGSCTTSGARLSGKRVRTMFTSPRDSVCRGWVTPSGAPKQVSADVHDLPGCHVPFSCPVRLRDASSQPLPWSIDRRLNKSQPPVATVG